MMRVYHDWEFLENGASIAPISVGMVTDDNHVLYLVNQDAPWSRIARHGWLMDNVVTHLPIALRHDGSTVFPIVNGTHPDATALVPAHQMSHLIRSFLEAAHHRSYPVGPREPAGLELWGYFPAYDHVVLAWQFGPMVDRPPVMPMTTFDIRQEMARDGLTEVDLPPQRTSQHHALADAYWARAAHRAIEEARRVRR